MADFKPNIYPIIYWGLMYGLIAGFILFLIYLLAEFITTIWIPVFLIGMVWGMFRNYRKQRAAAGAPTAAQTPVEEFKDAAQDIVSATRDMIANQDLDGLADEPAEVVEEEDVSDEFPVEEDVTTEEIPVEEVAAPDAKEESTPTPPMARDTTSNDTESTGRPNVPPPAPKAPIDPNSNS